jgi:hypothetical protein
VLHTDMHLVPARHVARKAVELESDKVQIGRFRSPDKCPHLMDVVRLDGVSSRGPTPSWDIPRILPNAPSHARVCEPNVWRVDRKGKRMDTGCRGRQCRWSKAMGGLYNLSRG